MLTLIVGLIITALGVYITFITCNLAFLLLYVIGLGLVFVPLVQPLSGWKNIEIINQYDLLPLSDDSECYVLEDIKGNLMYRYLSETGEAVVQHSTLFDTNYSSGNTDDYPRFKIGKLKPKKTLWCLPIFCSSKTQYVIYLPQDKVKTAIIK